MDKRVELIKGLIDKQGLSLKAFAEKIDLPYTTFYSILERGIGKASIDNVLKICRGLGITAEEMEKMASDEIDEIDEIETIAAHHEGEEWTEEELKTIEQFKEFVRSQRRNKE